MHLYPYIIINPTINCTIIKVGIPYLYLIDFPKEVLPLELICSRKLEKAIVIYFLIFYHYIRLTKTSRGDILICISAGQKAHRLKAKTFNDGSHTLL